MVVPGANVIHVGLPVTLTVAFGVPPVVTLNFRFLPAAIIAELAEVIVAVFDEGTTLLEGPEAALVPSALVALMVPVITAIRLAAEGLVEAERSDRCHAVPGVVENGEVELLATKLLPS